MEYEEKEPEVLEASVEASDPDVREENKAGMPVVLYDGIEV